MDISYYKKYEPVFGEWKIVREIGSGSFGKVFEIEREDFGYTYKAALKAVTIPQSQSEVDSIMDDGMDSQSVTQYFRSFVEELVDEFRLMSKLKGESNIVSYEDHRVIEHKDGIGWDILIRMELLIPLLKYTKEHSMTQADVVRLGIDICKALELCRKHNIIHRDIKPENIFVSENGKFKLGDFGIAKTVEKTMSGLSKKGTYTYMAPEVYKGEEYGPSVDIYSLGIVLYRYLNNNRAPFLPEFPAVITHSDRSNAIERRIKGETIPAPATADDELAAIVLKACAYDPKERYASATEMREALESALAELGEERKPAVAEAPKAVVEDEETVSLFGGMPDDDETVLMPVAEAPAEEETPVPADDAIAADEDETLSIIGGIPPIYDEPTQVDTKRSEPKKAENAPAKTGKKFSPKLLIAAAAAVVLIVVAVIVLGGKDDPAPDVTDALPSPASTDEAVENSSTSTPTDNSSSGKKNNSSGKRPSGSSSEKWGEWSEWGSEEIDPSDNVEVETRTVYTYNLYRYMLYNPMHSNYPDSGFESSYYYPAVRSNTVACVYRILKIERGYTDEEANKAVDPLYAYIRGRGSYEDAVNALASYDLTLAYETKTVTVTIPLEFPDKGGDGSETTVDGEVWYSATGEPDGTEVQYRSRTKS